jgi:uncharacterized protein YqgQ
MFHVTENDDNYGVIFYFLLIIYEFYFMKVVIGKIWNDELLTEDVSIARRFRYIMKTELNKTFSFEKLPENLNYWHNVYT